MWCPKPCQAAPDLYLCAHHPAACCHKPMQSQLWKILKDGQENPRLTKLKKTSQCGSPVCAIVFPDLSTTSPVAKLGLNPSSHTTLDLSIVYLLTGCFISYQALLQMVGTLIFILKSIPCSTVKIYFLFPAWD